MFHQLLRTAPDSVACHKNRDGKAHISILANLIWSLWFFGDLNVRPVSGQELDHRDRHRISDSHRAVGARDDTPGAARDFLLLGDGRHSVTRFWIGTTAAGPPASSTCVRCSLFVGTWRFSLSLMALFIGGFVVEAAWLQWPWSVIICMVSMALAIGGGNLARRLNEAKDDEIRLSHDEVRRLAATAERERIGRDLHDLLGHTLSLIALKSELAGKLIARDVVAARREIADVERITRDALVQVRSAVSGMRAAGLVGEIASARLLLECAGVRFAYSGFDRELPPAQEVCLALALREAATNIQRHARATSASADLVVDGDAIQLRVRDDGQGGISAHGNGLVGMRERVEALGGSLWIEATRGKGTVLTLRLPMTMAATNVIGIADGQRKARA